MKQSELEKHLGELVKITIFDGQIITGELHKAGEERYKAQQYIYLKYLKPDYYFLECPQSFLFRCLDVRKLEVL